MFLGENGFLGDKVPKVSRFGVYPLGGSWSKGEILGKIQKKWKISMGKGDRGLKVVPNDGGGGGAHFEFLDL